MPVTLPGAWVGSGTFRMGLRLRQLFQRSCILLRSELDGVRGRCAVQQRRVQGGGDDGQRHQAVGHRIRQGRRRLLNHLLVHRLPLPRDAAQRELHHICRRRFILCTGIRELLQISCRGRITDANGLNSPDYQSLSL